MIVLLTTGPVLFSEIEDYCPVLNLKNGIVTGSQRAIGSSVTFSCSDGFRLSGSGKSTCTAYMPDNGAWNGTRTCESKFMCCKTTQTRFPH